MWESLHWNRRYLPTSCPALVKLSLFPGCELMPFSRQCQSSAHAALLQQGTVKKNTHSKQPSHMPARVCACVHTRGQVSKPFKFIHLRLEMFGFFPRLHSQLILNRVPRLNTLSSYIACFDICEPGQAPSTSLVSGPDFNWYVLSRGHSERRMTVDFQGHFERTRTPKRASRGTEQFGEGHSHLSIGDDSKI